MVSYRSSSFLELAARSDSWFRSKRRTIGRYFIVFRITGREYHQRRCIRVRRFCSVHRVDDYCYCDYSEDTKPESESTIISHLPALYSWRKPYFWLQRNRFSPYWRLNTATPSAYFPVLSGCARIAEDFPDCSSVGCPDSEYSQQSFAG